MTVIVTTHYLDEAEHCHRLALMHAGRLVALGTVSRAQGGLRRARGAGGGCPRVGEALERSREPALGARDLGLRHPAPRGGRATPRRVGARSASSSSADGNSPAVDRADRPLARGRLHPLRREREPKRDAGREPGRMRQAPAPSWSRRCGRSGATPSPWPMLLGLPAFMLVLYGYALNFDVRHVRLAVQDRDRSAASRELHRRLRSTRPTSTWWPTRRRAPTWSGSPSGAWRGRSLVIPEGYARDLAAGRAAPVQLLLDGADSNTATDRPRLRPRPRRRGRTPASSAARLARAGDATSLRRSPSSRACWFNPELQSTQFLVPGPDRLHPDAHRRALDRALGACARRSAGRWSSSG